LVYFWIILSCVFYAGGEYVSKLWSLNPINYWLLIGAASLYIITTMFWFPTLLINNKLSQVGLIWVIFETISLLIVGVLVFGERLTTTQWIGAALTTVALILISI